MSKKIITSSVLVLLAVFAFAQENFTVKMSMKIEGLPPEMAGMGDNDFVNYIKGEKYRSEMTGMMGSKTTIFDGKKMTELNEQMGDKSGYTATKEEIEAANKSEKNDSKPKVEYTTEKKMIAGYECTKALITSVDKEKKEHIVIVWVTDKIKSPEMRAKNRQMDLGDLKGYPMEMEMKQNANGMDMKFTFTTSEVITTDIDDKLFTPNTDGYKMLTYKEHQEKMKAIQAQYGGGK